MRMVPAARELAAFGLLRGAFMRTVLSFAPEEVGQGSTLLVVPEGPSGAIPLHLQDREWRLLRSTDLTDSTLRGRDDLVLRAIEAEGHFLSCDE